ncbi:hypothetical protein O1L55_38645 [Streptomyces albulus]|nr:hypothetical protein [Streptomyces noursei]
MIAAAARWAGRAPGRPRLVGVGRFAAHIDFSVELGNLDIRYAARCGAGYRDAAYARGLRDVKAPPGEGTVTENLQRALDLIDIGAVRPRAMNLPRLPLERAAEAYAGLRERPAHPAVLLHYGPHEGARRRDARRPGARSGYGTPAVPAAEQAGTLVHRFLEQVAAHPAREAVVTPRPVGPTARPPGAPPGSPPR